MILSSFGCSFIFGSELPDDGSTGFWHVPSNQSWPALCAQSLGMAYDCRAKPGSGNLQILETLINHLATTSADIYIIGWTWIDRFDFVDTGADIWPANCTSWRTLTPGTQSALATTYYQEIHTEQLDKLRSILCVKSAIDILKTANKKFIMTYIDDLMFDKTCNTSPGLLELQDYCWSSMTTFEGKDFLSFTRAKNFPVSKQLHPLAEAHTTAASLMLPAIDTILHKA